MNHYKPHGHRYQYYGIQHYNHDSKKRYWCYLGKYESLPGQYKIMIHNNQNVSTTDPQTAKTGKNPFFSENSGAGSGIRTPDGVEMSPAIPPLFLGLKFNFNPKPKPLLYFSFILLHRHVPTHTSSFYFIYTHTLFTAPHTHKVGVAEGRNHV